MAFHLILNSLIVFVILTFLIDLSLAAFNVNNARIRYICRLLPILKFPLDLVVFTFYGENVAVNFNPFSCEVYMHDLITSFIPVHMKQELAPNEHFIIPQYLATYIPSPYLNIMIAIIIFASFAVLAKKVYVFYHARAYLKHVLVSSQPCSRAVFNLTLLNELKRRKVLVLTSEEVQMPFAAHLRYIFLPKDLVAELSQEEFEAVIVHELEHLRWKDPILKMTSDLICALLWWLPSTWWLKRLELEQEDACDAEMGKYGIDGTVLATAIVKVIKKAKYLNYQFSAICPFDSPKNSHTRRLKNILNINNKNAFRCHHLFAILACLLASVCFWMC